MSTKSKKTKTKKKHPKGFTLLQWNFVNEYFIEKGNGTKAAKKAGYEGDYNTLSVTAYDNLRKPKIRDEINRRLSELVMTSNEVLKELSDIAHGFDILNYVSFKETYALDKGGNAYFTGLTIVPDVDKMQADGVSKLIKEVRQVNKGVTFVMHDKLKALEDVGKFHVLFTDKIQIDTAELEIVQLIRDGEITYEWVAEKGGDSLADRLFKQAGVEIGKE